MFWVPSLPLVLVVMLRSAPPSLAVMLNRMSPTEVRPVASIAARSMVSTGEVPSSSELRGMREPVTVTTSSSSPDGASCDCAAIGIIAAATASGSAECFIDFLLSGWIIVVSVLFEWRVKDRTVRQPLLHGPAAWHRCRGLLDGLLLRSALLRR